MMPMPTDPRAQQDPTPGAQPSYRRDALMSQLGGPPSQTPSGGLSRGGMPSGPKPAPPAMAPRTSLQNLSAAYQGAGGQQASPPQPPMPTWMARQPGGLMPIPQPPMGGGAGQLLGGQGGPMRQPPSMPGPELPPGVLEMLIGGM